jgi:hypothetical protein
MPSAVTCSFSDKKKNKLTEGTNMQEKKGARCSRQVAVRVGACRERKAEKERWSRQVVVLVVNASM